MNYEYGPIGEVIEASTTEFIAESRELHSPPPFGSFVKVACDMPAKAVSQLAPEPLPTDGDDPFMDSFRGKAGTFNSDLRNMVEGDGFPKQGSLSSAIYGVVYHACTASTEMNRRPRAYWKDEQQLNDVHPELAEWLLMTEFKAIIIGYSADGLMRQFLPPQPPKIHLAVQICNDEEIRLITEKMDFLRTLTNSRSAPSEEVVAACIREADRARRNDFRFLVSAGKELAALLRDDYDRLNAIMRRVSP